jgi:hypothetical protein
MFVNSNTGENGTDGGGGDADSGEALRKEKSPSNFSFVV